MKMELRVLPLQEKIRHRYRGKTQGRHREETAVCKPRRPIERGQPSQHLHLRLLASRNCEKIVEATRHYVV